MHYCLEVKDVFDLILEHVNLQLWREGDYFQGYHNHTWSNPNLLALALTCKTFLEPTLDLMWRDHLHLAPLVRTLPADAILEKLDLKSEEYPQWHLKIVRPLIKSDWSRFDYYAPRIKSLGYFDYEFADQRVHYWGYTGDYPCYRPLDWRTIAQLCLYRRERCLLPNLVRLRWIVYGAHYWTHLPMFFGPRLGSLAIAWHPQQCGTGQWPELGAYAPEEVAAVLEAAGALCPTITQLDILPTHAKPVVDAAIKFAQGCRRLEGFFVSPAGPWDHDTLVFLASQPHLQIAFLEVDEETGEGLESILRPISPYPFQSLQTLWICTPALSACVTLIEAMGPCKLEHLTFEVTARTYPDVLQALFTALRDRCDKRTLLAVGVICHAERVWPVRPPQDTVTIETILPLLAFPNIRVFRLALPLLAAINDHEICHIADSWPHLVVFAFMEWRGILVPAEITWEGMAYVLYRCQNLISLELAIDTTKGDVRVITGKPDFRCPPYLRFLHLLDSILAEPRVVADTIYTIAPKIVDIDGYIYPRLGKDGEETAPPYDVNAYFRELNNLLWEKMGFDVAGGSKPPDHPHGALRITLTAWLGAGVNRSPPALTEADEMNPWSETTQKKDPFWQNAQREREAQQRKREVEL